MRKTTNVQSVSTFIILIVLSFISYKSISQCNPGNIEGHVFVDADFNGVNDNSDEGLSGIIVRAFNGSGIAMSQAISGNNGFYSLQGLNDGDEYRVVFELPDKKYVSALGPGQQVRCAICHCT